MKTFKYPVCDNPTSSATNDSSNEAQIKQSVFFRLPFELRRLIYLHSISRSRSPTPKDVYKKNLLAVWEDLPSPLLRVNKQIRAEIFDVLHKFFFTFRITSTSANFDMLGLSCFIAQQRPKSYGDLPDLRIEIWPPHPDRPIEMFYIHRHLCILRDELRAVSHIPKLTIRFVESSLAKWTQDGAPRFDLSNPGETEPLLSDFAKVLDHFACITNITDAHIYLPSSLKHLKCKEQYEELKWHASDVIETMRGEGTLACFQKYTLNDFPEGSLSETSFQRATAQKARAKLDAITLDGQHKMTEAEWYDFTQVWPYFEILTKFDEGGPFKGEDHYRI